MRLSEFWDRMRAAFGPAYADSLARDQAIPALGSRTVREALAAGEEAKTVWRAVCEHCEVPSRLR